MNQKKNEKNDNPEFASKATKNKKQYIKPKIISEKLNSYGAVCNGSTAGGRKASTAGPAFCNASRISS